MRKNFARSTLNDCLLIHGGLIPLKSKPLNDFYFLSSDFKWLKVFALEGPKARCYHQMAGIGNTVYLIGGYSKCTNGLNGNELEKCRMTDMWKFEFENAK